MPPLAYLLTWTTYGTWVHGDERGSVHQTDPRYDTPMLVPSRQRRDMVRAHLREAPLVLDEADRKDVHASILSTVAHRRWKCAEINVRTNHIHAVVGPGDTAPETIMVALKRWATRALKATGRHAGRERFWTDHGSTRHLFFEEGVRGACMYVRDQDLGRDGAKRVI